MFGAKGNLSPVQRAVLKFVETLLWGAFLSGLQAATPLLSNPDLSVVNWGSVLHTFLAAFLLAVTLGISKYHTAQGDPPLSSPLSSPPSVPAPSLTENSAATPSAAAASDPAATSGLVSNL